METKKEILDNLQRDCNQYSAQELQMFVKDGILEWSDLSTIYSERQLHAIYEWTLPMHRSYEGTINISQSGLEIYVWGDYKAGKTCFIGAICSVLGASGMCILQSKYAEQLCHMFHGDVCTLPLATLNNIHVMQFQIREERGNARPVYIIEMPSNIGRVMYKAQNGIVLTEEEHSLLNQTMSYLRNTRNCKMHFFLMEYGCAGEKTHREDSYGLTQENYLSTTAKFLHNEGIFLKGKTLEVCGMVTKSDRIDTYSADRPLLAYEYVRTSFDLFWRTIADICKQANIPTICISFSIGKVFAQDLCEIDISDAVKVIEHLQSICKRKSFFSWLKEKFYPKKRPAYI